ncbi:MAG TPA: hypothetical protein VE978_09225 [Chitinophagales bacterium]|nr:hypothetical protein [Chitinophagales bacterium]
MILLQHHQTRHQVLQGIDDTYPFTFLRCYHEFERSMGGNTGILWEEKTDIMIPVKFYRKNFFSFAQFLFHPIKKNQPVSEAEEKYFLQIATGFLKDSYHVQRILHSPPFVNFHTAPDKSNFCPFGIYYTDLEQDEAAIFQNIQSRTRRYIQKAGDKNGLQIKTGESNLRDFYSLHVSTMKREAASYESFEKLEQFMKFLSPGNMLCMVAYRNEIPEAGLLIPYSYYAGVLYFGGESENPTGAITNKWLHWEAMRKLKERNVKKMIFGGVRMGDIKGTKYEGIQFFKERFGPKLENGVLWKMDLQPGYARLYDGLMNVRNIFSGKKSRPDIIDFYHLRNPAS